MKKSTLIIILVIYVASIAAINFFGLSVKVYDKIINVTSVECINRDDEERGIIVSEEEYGKYISVKFTEPGMLFALEWRTFPDNATNKDVQFVYDKTSQRFEFMKDDFGRETGRILIYKPVQFSVSIMSCDGTLKKADVTISVK